MLRKFLSRFSLSCIQRQDEVDEPEQSNIENENTTRPKGYSSTERPKSRQIPIPSTRSWASGGSCHKDSCTRDYEADANTRANRNKCSQNGGDIKMARINRQGLMNVDEGFQFGSKAERNREEPSPRKDADTERSLLTAGNSTVRCASGRVNLPRNCMIKIGSIVESADGSLPRITVAENLSERMIFQLADVGSTILRSTNLRETGIYYNTNSGTVELHGGMLQSDYTI